MHQISCDNLDTQGSVLSTLFTTFLTSILTRQCEFGKVKYPTDRSNDVNPTLHRFVEVDMIVVGSGSSGSVIANRLSEVTKWNVLLIEAGDDPSVSSYIPALTFALQKSSIDWAYQSQQQPGVCEGLQNGVCNVPRGKALGGSSNLNAMMYLVGNPNDYNSWGNSDWNFKSVEKYFHKSFKDYYYVGFANKSFRHQNYFNINHMTETIERASKELRIEKLKYKNSNINPNKAGTLHLKTSIRDGERLNVAKAFLAPIKDRPNLFVMKNALVTKILIDNKKATSVQIYQDKEYYEIKINKELIISAGAVNTPQLLFQSGIGDEELLKKENIDVKINLPSVGKYLYDHPLFVVPIELTTESSKRKKKVHKPSEDNDFANEGNKAERKEKKNHDDDSGFGEEQEEKTRGKNKKNSGRGKSKKNHKHKDISHSHKDKNETDVTEDEKEIEMKTTTTTTVQPVSFLQEPEVENGDITTTPTAYISEVPSTFSTSTFSTSTFSTSTPRNKFDNDYDADDYDDGYEPDDEDEEKHIRSKRSSRNKNKKNKNQSSTTENPQVKSIASEPPQDLPPSEEIFKYIMEKAGPLAGIGTGDYVTFIDTTGKSPNNPNVIIMYCFYPQSDKSGLRTLLHAYNWSPSMIDAIYQKQSDILLMIPTLLKPISYGNVTFNNNALEKGKIYLNYFHEKEDINTMVKSVRFIENFIDTKSFQKHYARLIRVPDTTCDDMSYDSDEYWKCTLKRRASSCYHLSSTARMGDNTLSSVVNYKLQVHGLDNVRIADASVMPYTVGANIHATCVMIGEKCADIVKQDWKERT